MSTETVTLHYATRLKNSVNGNPRFRLATSAGDLITQSDAMVNYEITNLKDGNEYTFSLSKAGRVTGLVE